MEEIFWMNDAHLFFEVIDHTMMFISLYCALWMCNFITTSHEIMIATPAAWQLFGITPGILSVIVYTFVIRSAALLKVLSCSK